ncbi:MAG: hypothetical protein ACRDIB_11710 [Ardenticatenaceae bacterium]
MENSFAETLLDCLGQRWHDLGVIAQDADVSRLEYLRPSAVVDGDDCARLLDAYRVIERAA